MGHVVGVLEVCREIAVHIVGMVAVCVWVLVAGGNCCGGVWVVNGLVLVRLRSCLVDGELLELVPDLLLQNNEL